MSDMPGGRTEDQLLAVWSVAEASLSHIARAEGDPKWEAAVAEEWRANIAYRQAVTDRLQREAKDSRDAKSRPPVKGRRRRG
jgi:hypothetical protein